jgi:hypothetical protein
MKPANGRLKKFMKKNIFLPILLIATYSAVQCIDEAPVQQRIDYAPERRSSTGWRLSLTGHRIARVAPMPLPDKNTGPAGAGVGVGADEGLTPKPLVHQDAVRGAAPKGPREAAALAAKTHPADRPHQWTRVPMQVKSQQNGRYQNICNTSGYSLIPFVSDLVMLTSGSDITTPAQIKKVQNGQSTYYTLHQHSGALYAIKRDPIQYYIVTLNGLQELSAAELIDVYGMFTKKTVISYKKLYTVNRILTEAIKANAAFPDGASMQIFGESGYTLFLNKGVMYAFQNHDRAKFQRALKTFEKKGTDNGSLFSFLLFSKLLHTPLDLLKDPIGRQFKEHRRKWYHCC